MAEPGWYPDPEGAPGRFRYWDGQRWAAEAVDSPPGRPKPSGRLIAILGAALAAVVAIVIITVIMVRPDRAAAPDTNPPRPSAGGWDDSSPTSSASPSPSVSPSASRGPSSRAATIPRPAGHCPDGEPKQSVKHADDGRVHGGQLSFDPVSGHGFDEPRVDDHYGWWYDEHIQPAVIDSGAGAGRTARLAVGSLAIRDGFRSAHQAARSSLRCVISTGDYRRYTGQQLVRSRKTSVDGEQGWELITDVGVRPTGDGAAGDRIRLLVIDAGAPGSFSIFVGVSPLGDSSRSKIINATVADLKVGY